MLTRVGEASQSLAVYTRVVVAGCIMPRVIRLKKKSTSTVAIHAVVDGLVCNSCNHCPMYFPFLCQLPTVTSLELDLYSCSGDPTTVTCAAEQVPYLEWEIRAGMTVLGSSMQPTEGTTTIGDIQVTSVSTPNADDPELLDIQSTLTFTPTQVPENVRFRCSSTQGGLSVSSQITHSQNSYGR